VRGETNVPHIALATRADIVLVAPASAHTIHRLASGSCSDLLSLTVAATRAPVVVVPAMNSAMLSCRAVERNIARLKSDGFYVVEPGLGFEVSNTSDGNLGFCGAAVNERNVAMVLRGVLNLHAARKAHALRPENISSGELTTVEGERAEESVKHVSERFEVEQGFDKAV
jgi:phosphopantothenoylcysteine synthetase/decarboxylase